MSKALFVGFKIFIDLGIYCELQLWVTWAFWVLLAIVKFIYGRKSENASPRSFIYFGDFFFFSLLEILFLLSWPGNILI